MSRLFVFDECLYVARLDEMNKVLTRISNSRDKIEKNYQTTVMALDLLLNNISLQYKCGNTIISDLQLENGNNDVCMLSDLLEKEYKMVFFFSYMHCESCVVEIFQKISNIGKEIALDDIIVVGQFENKRSLETYVKYHKIKIPVYYSRSGSLADLVKETGLPFICMMNRDLKPEDIIFPIKELPKQLGLYMNEIKRKYFHK